MKRRLLLILSVLLPTMLMANPVGKEEAKEKALSFLNGRSSAKARGLNSVKALRLVKSEPCYYVFNIGSRDGFVIVSGDDCAPEILGYADSGEVDPQNMPENMKAWLQGYADQIEWMKEKGYAPAKAKTAKKAIKAEIAPLVQTHWNQDEPYNNIVKEFFTYKDAVTGCVATAMAQIMYYTEKKAGNTSFPLTKEIPTYTTRYGSTVPAVPVGTVLNWDNMLTSYDGEATDEQKTAVATLMQCCGTSVEMNYANQASGGSSATTSEVVTALKTYFDYNETTQYAVRSFYSYADWINIIYHELSNQRPVIYDGQKRAGGGHAFIVDGYESEDYFHVNWGWGGLSDGCFKLSAMDSDAEGIGGSSSEGGYCVGQGAVIGVQKNGGTGTVLDVEQFTINSSTFNVNSVVADKTNATVGETVQIKVNITNKSAKDYDGDLYIVDKNGQGILSTKTFLIPAGATQDCVMTFCPDAARTYDAFVCFPSPSGGYWYWYTKPSTGSIEVTEGGSSETETDDITLSRSVKVENCLDSDNNFYGPGSQNTFKATITVSNPETDKIYRGTCQIDLYTTSNALAGRFNSTITIPANSSIAIPFEAYGLENNTNYKLEMVYIKAGAWTEWDIIGTYTAKPGAVSYSADGTQTIAKASGSFEVPASAVAVDLSGTGVTSVTKNSKANCLYILKNTDAIPSGLSNVIKYDGTNYTASSITLTDGYDFYSPVDFTATNIEFDYAFTVGADGTKGWNTLVLPFNVTKVTAGGTEISWFKNSSEKGKNFWVKEFTDDAVGSVTFNYTDAIKANKPYIVAFPGNHWGTSWDLSSKAIKFIGQNVTVYNSGIRPSVTGGYYRFIGSTSAVGTKNIYCLDTNANKFVLKATGGSEAFRAFFKADTYDRTVTSLAIVGPEGNATGIESVNSSEQSTDKAYYNLNGQRVDKPSKGLYILNGKKVIIK